MIIEVNPPKVTKYINCIVTSLHQQGDARNKLDIDSKLQGITLESNAVGLLVDTEPATPDVAFYALQSYAPISAAPAAAEPPGTQARRAAGFGMPLLGSTIWLYKSSTASKPRSTRHP